MSAAPTPLVSVVTPLYNAANYIGECVESVRAQSYENWEYVIVDNKSTDGSLDIVKSYARRDPRIRVHENSEFLAAIANWNHAVRQMSPEGKYLKVVHADDWLFPHCLESMVALAEAHPSIGLVSSYRLAEERVDLDGLPYPSHVLPGREVARMSLLRGNLHLFGSPTSVLVRADLARKRVPFYNEDNIHADSEVCLDLLQEADFGFVHQVLSFTRRHNEAMTSFLHRMRTHRAGKLMCLKRYGPVFLTPEEFETRVRQHTLGYHNFLARAVFERRGKEFWDYHKKVLRGQGVEFSRWRLVKPLILGSLERLLRPKTTVRNILNGGEESEARREASDAKNLDRQFGG